MTSFRGKKNSSRPRQQRERERETEREGEREREREESKPGRVAYLHFEECM
jgi:hypothetical protein